MVAIYDISRKHFQEDILIKMCQKVIKFIKNITFSKRRGSNCAV